jgi:vacuolar protein sorting-associated protein 53
LNQYGDILRQKLVSEKTAGKPGTHAAYHENMEKDMCYVVNTAEYCADTIPQLEDLIKSKIDEPYREKVSLTAEQDVFFDVIATSIRTLVGGLESQAEVAFKAMQAVNWGAFDMVGEESGYVRTINAAVLKYIPNCRSILSSLYFRNFCDKFAASFCPAFLNLIQKQRRISEEGTQQLLLDLYNLKKMMLDLPRIGSEHEINVPVSYRKYVEKHMSKVERLLKLVATPVSMLVEHFRMMWPEGGNKELQVVMSLKGMKRTEQITVLETFGGGATSAAGGGGGSGGGASSGNVGDGGEEDGDLKARAMKGMKGAMDDFQKISSGMTVGMKTAFR